MHELTFHQYISKSGNNIIDLISNIFFVLDMTYRKAVVIKFHNISHFYFTYVNFKFK